MDTSANIHYTTSIFLITFELIGHTHRSLWLSRGLICLPATYAIVIGTMAKLTFSP